jgi:hypothetical protein
MYKCETNLVKDDNGYLLVDSHNISKRCKNYCAQQLKVNSVGDVRHILLLWYFR